MNYIDQTKILNNNLKYISGNDELVRDIFYDLTDDGRFRIGVEFWTYHSEPFSVNKHVDVKCYGPNSKFVLWKGEVVSDKYFYYDDVKPTIDRIVEALGSNYKNSYIYYMSAYSFSYNKKVRKKKISDISDGDVIQRVIIEFKR